MRFITDFHIHSHYSIATSKNLTPASLDFWARRKGINLIGTGDIIHPAWFKEIKEKLIPAEGGLFRLKDEYSITEDKTAPQGDQLVRFILSGEISSIYRDRGRVRKVHNLIMCSSFDTVKRIQRRLEGLGNISSDGRPILGISSRNLLEITLEAGDDAVFIPAHIWTPWFSVLGAKSGYDSIEQCFGDLAGHIFAVETGLSSDPPMNWLCSSLDKYTLISNSDAHSPEKLGREANLFDTELSYSSIVKAMKDEKGDAFIGTIEFFPQEGKYHFDGHRKCGVRWTPEETIKHKGICPVCGKTVTVGVLNRVVQLADRDDPETRPRKKTFFSLTPLKNLIAEIKGVGPDSKKVLGYYEQLIREAGSEFTILLDLSYDEVTRIGGDILSEGIKRLRNRVVYIEEGYDGEFGMVRVFEPGEIRNISSQTSLFYGTNRIGEKRSKKDADHLLFHKKIQVFHGDEKKEGEACGIYDEFKMDIAQEEAVRHYKGPCLILAGPGTGKTMILTERVARLVKEHGVDPEKILAVTFTNKAAGEMRKRVRGAIGNERKATRINISTFHSFGMSLLRESSHVFGRSSDFFIYGDDERKYILHSLTGCKGRDLQRISNDISMAKNREETLVEEGRGEIKNIYSAYEERLKTEDAFDIDDLVLYPVKLLRDHCNMGDTIRNRYQWICVDEYQDINNVQYRLIRLLAPFGNSNVFVIGDPDQAIYSFRGANNIFIQRFKDDYPSASVYKLRKSYRCPSRILEASKQVVYSPGEIHFLDGVDEGVSVHIQECETAKSEAEFVARSIERLMGGVRFFSIDSRITDGIEDDRATSFSDFAVFFRISRMANDIVKALNDHGIPFQFIGEEPFFRHEPLSLIIDVLKLIAIPDQPLLWKRLSEKKIKSLSEDSILKLRGNKEKKSIEDYIREVVTTFFSGSKTSYENDVERLIAISQEYGNDLLSFLFNLKLGSAVDAYDKSAEQVSLMTIHAAKGLEFPYVFIIGCEDGIMPYTMKDDHDREEEKRILYVGMTRAESSLFLSHAKKRYLYGNYLNLPVSPFLSNIKEELIVRGEGRKRRVKAKSRQLSLFS